MAKYNKNELYFFKFPDDFFESDEIEELLSDYDGDSTVILYLKLILLAVNKHGYLAKIIAGELKPYSVDELCRKTHTEEEDFKKKLKRLKEVGLIELKDDILFIEQALKYTNQTVGAFKKELQRKDEDVYCPPNCPPELDIRNQNLESRIKNLDIINNNLESYSSEQLLPEGDNTHPALQDIVYRVIEHLNNKTFRNYKPTTKNTIAKIKYLLSKGYKEEDFITVIDKMTECWIGLGPEEYLRPDTLFGPNFEDYLEGDWTRQETDWSAKYLEEY